MGATMELTLDVTSSRGFAVVNVTGEVDVFTAPKLREKLIELVEKGETRIIVGLEGVEFLDSTGLGVLVAGLKRAKTHDGSLSIACANERILKIFRITGLNKVFGIHDTVQAAIEGGGKAPDGA